MNKDKTRYIFVLVGIAIGVPIGLGIMAGSPMSSSDDPFIDTMMDNDIDKDLMDAKMDDDLSATNPDIKTSLSSLPAIVDVGILLPATGDLSSHGQDNSIAAELGVVDFNKYLEDLGADWRMRKTVEDTQTDPIIALEKLQALNSKGINLIFGAETSAEIRNIKSYADSNGMLLISPSSSSPVLAVPDNIFRLVPDDRKQGRVIAKLIESHDISVVIPVWRADVWGDGLQEASSKNFVELGGMVDEGIRYSPETTVFSTEALLLSEKLTKYVEQGIPKEKIAVLLISFSEAVHFMNAASSYEELSTIRWFGSGASANDDLITHDPIASEFAKTTSFTATQVAALKNPKYDHVTNHVIEKIGTSPSNFAYSAYDSVWILGLAIHQTQSTDIETLKKVIPLIAEHHSGSLGKIIRLNDAGDLELSDYELWQIQDDDWINYGRYSAETDTIVR